jgi:hypothetical protein
MKTSEVDNTNDDLLDIVVSLTRKEMDYILGVPPAQNQAIAERVVDKLQQAVAKACNAEFLRLNGGDGS